MNELMTDFWSILLPEEWEAEQDGETIIISDDDEVSVIEMTPLIPDDNVTSTELLQSIAGNEYFKTALAELDAYYKEFEEDGMFWREWFCDAETFVIAISHGSDISNKNMDDSTVDEILSTLALKIKQD